MNQTFPEDLINLVFIPHLEDRLNQLAELAETEDWEYRDAAERHAHPVLYNYLRFTYRRLAEEEKKQAC